MFKKPNTNGGRCKSTRKGFSQRAAFSLAELIIASGVGVISLAGIMYGYVLSSQSAEYSAYHLAAHSLAMQRLEQTRAAKWDLQATPTVDELVPSKFPMVVDPLDIPISKTNIVYATNRTTITSVSTAPPLKMIRVECSWKFASGRIFTNTVVTYRAPDQ